MKGEERNDEEGAEGEYQLDSCGLYSLICDLYSGREWWLNGLYSEGGVAAETWDALYSEGEVVVGV